VAGKTPGTYLVVARTYNGLADTAKVVVSGSTGGTTRQVVLSPSSATVETGEQRQFGLTGKASDGSTFSVRPSYQVTGGTVSSSGVFQAGRTPGTYRIIGTDANTGLADTSAITVTADEDDGNDGGTIASVSVSPSSTGIRVGDTQQLSATVRDGNGNTVGSAQVTWTSSNRSVATVSASGVVTGLSGGQTTVTATAGGKSDDASITVTSVAPPPPPNPGGTGNFSSCEDLPSAGRVVNVSSSSALSSALSNAQPGDRIVLAPGTYSGNKSFSNRSGTQSQPIVLCGPRSAVITGDIRPTGIRYWIFQGFTIRDAFQAFYATNSSNNQVRGLEIYNVGQEAVRFRCGSSDNIIQGNWIHHTGRSSTEWGEAVYIGSWSSHWSQCGGTDRSDRNQILNNKLGPNVTAEHLEIKEGTSGGVIRGNTIDGSGMVQTQSWNDSWAEIKGNNYLIEDNVGTRSIKHGFETFASSGYGNNNTFRGNRAEQIPSSGYGFKVTSGSGNVVTCDNVVTGGRLADVSCR
jgi:hypothetical protein